MMKQRRKYLAKGFSLIEIMIVLVIVGMLAAATSFAVTKSMDKARQSAAKSEIATMASALKQYYAEKASYPTTSQGLKILAPNFIEKLNKDPWKNDYIYRVPGADNHAFEILSLGADKQEGGTGINQDISNWNLDEVSIDE